MGGNDRKDFVFSLSLWTIVAWCMYWLQRLEATCIKIDIYSKTVPCSLAILNSAPILRVHHVLRVVHCRR